jgi:serine/threonine-protein kinase
MADFVGTVFHNRYEILEVLGSGGTSVVYKAKDIILNRPVTIKILREQFAKDEKFVTRFRNEAQAVAKLSHPNIVNIYDVAFSEGMHYLVMEYVEGGSLKEYLDENAPLPIDEALNIFQQLLSALQHAHENNVIHRDIKPHNILLDTKHNVRVTDFGLAVTTGDLTIETGSNDIMGSVYYMSPEQIKGETASAATDIYSAGVVLYEMLCGKRPFVGKTAVEIARQHMKGSCVPPHKINPNVSTELSSYVMKSMRRDKELRFASAGQMLAELKAIQNKNRRVVVKPLSLDIMPNVGDSSQTVKPEDERTVVVKRHINLPEQNSKKLVFFKDKKPTPLFFMTLFACLLLLVLFGSLFSIIGSLNSTGKEVEVKQYVGMTLEEAAASLDEDGLQYTTISTYSDEYDNDVVMKQNIAAGQKVKTGRFIELTVSQGSRTFTMPLIEGMTLSEARVSLSKNNVTIESEDVVDDEVAAGKIVSQEPAEGEEVAAGSVIKVTVSKGKEIVVPDLRGRTEDDALVYLSMQGLTLGNISNEQSTEYDAGYVIGQSPKAGETTLEGSSIDLVVSSGPGPQSKTARVTYTLPSGEDVTYDLIIEVTDDKGTRQEYRSSHKGGETIVRDVSLYGSGTVKVYLDGDVVYSQDVA